MPRPAIAHINLGNLRHNFRLLRKRAGAAEVMAVVKANAYGHGLFPVAEALLGEGCKSFAVTDANEGESLRSMFDSSHPDFEISLLSGVFHAENVEQCVDARLTPVITEPDQIDILLRKSEFRGAIWLKFDSGMNRLGAAVPAELFTQAKDAGLRVRGFMSHLACADEQSHPLLQSQAQKFVNVCSSISPSMDRSLLNSAGMITLPECAFELVRPGIALYGVEPVSDRFTGLKPVMTLSGKVMQVRHIQPGESVSYGALFVARKPMRVAVVSIGYADGIPWKLSNCGSVFIRNSRYAIVGRVCMDYTMIDVSDSDVQRGDKVEFWGEHIPTKEVARQLDTISYTLFSGVSQRVIRKTE